MKKMWRTSWSDTIEEFEVERETLSSVWFIKNNGTKDRELKVSQYRVWHDTRDEAKVFLVAKQSREIEKLERQVEFAKEKLEKIKLL